MLRILPTAVMLTAGFLVPNLTAQDVIEVQGIPAGRVRIAKLADAKEAAAPQEAVAGAQPTTQPTTQPTSQPTSAPTAVKDEIPAGFLELISGERLSGRLEVEKESTNFRWKSDTFDRPLVFGVESLHRVVFPPRPGQEEPDGLFRIEMHNGDVVFGKMIAADPETVTLATARHGTIKVTRVGIAKIESLKRGATAYAGPNGIPQWTARSKPADVARAWHQTGDALETSDRATPIVRMNCLESGARLTLSLAWTQTPSFIVRLGVGSDAKKDRACIAVETWGEVLVAYREGAENIEIVELSPKLKADSEMKIVVDIAADAWVFVGEDGETGRLARRDSDGRGILLQNIASQTFRLTEISVDRRLPAEGLGDSAMDLDAIAGIDDAGNILVVDGIGRSQEEITLIRGRKFESAEKPAVSTTFALHDGTLATGEFVGIAPDRMKLRVPWATEPVDMPLSNGNLLVFNSKAPKKSLGARRLVCEANTVRGDIAGFDAASKMIEWKLPLGQEPAKLDVKKPFKMSLNEISSFTFPRATYPHRILFMNQDCVPCKIIDVTDEKVVFESFFGKQRREVLVADVKAIEFDAQRVRSWVDDARIAPQTNEMEQYWIPNRSDASKDKDRSRVDKSRRETALAQPRKYKSNPPKHIFIGKNADVFRGSMSEFTEQNILVGSGLSEPIALSRESLIALVFLHPTVPSATTPAASQPTTQPTSRPSQAGRVEFKLDKDFRVSGFLKSAGPNSFSVTSPLLGDFDLLVEDIEEVLGGDLCGKSPGFFSTWVLIPMPEPVIQ